MPALTMDLKAEQPGATPRTPHNPSWSSRPPDVVLDLTSDRTIREAILMTRVDVWSIQHGLREDHDGTGCFWELFREVPLTHVTLHQTILEPDGACRQVPLERATFPTVPHSYRRNLDQAFLGSVELPTQACRRFLARSGQPLLHSVAPSHSAPEQAPSGAQIARFLPHLATTWVRRQVTGLTRADRWHVGIVNRPIESLLEHPTLRDVDWLERPNGADRYVADPFGCIHNNAKVVLVEDFDHRERHGRISAYRFDTRGHLQRGVGARSRSRAGQPTPILSLPNHASYPYLVEVDGRWWCIPETSAAGEVRAYELDPETLVLSDLGPLLTDEPLADPTLFEWQGRWWLFGTDRSRGANTHLRAWWAEHPSGPWVQHAIDPLCIDVRWTRGAGTPFVNEGVLYRPAQDCSQGYGGSVVIRRVVALDPTHFEEDVAAVVRPDPEGPYPDGAHTISGIGDSFLVDGSRQRFSAASFLYELRARIRQFRRTEH